jgi:hypothetical protein
VGGNHPDEGTSDRSAVNYRAAHRDKRCGTCAQFDAAARACSVVAGAIAANMVCDRWAIMPGLTRADLDPPPRPR